MRLKAAARRVTLGRVWKELRQKVGLATLKAFGFAAVLGLITYFLGHQGAGFTVAAGILVALAVASGSFFWLLVLAVGDLELKFEEADETVELMNQKIGAHRAIYGWVDGCESALTDRSQALPTMQDRVAQELMFLEANVVNSLSSYPHYPPSLIDQVKEIAAGKPGEAAAIRLERLLAQLRKNLAAGTYLV